MHMLGAMKFTCNPVKNETNIRGRGLSLLAARVMFNSAMVVREDTGKTNISKRRIIVSKRNLKLKASDPAPEIDWAAVDAAPLTDTPDEVSPELTAKQFAELRPLREVLPATGKTRITIMLDDTVLQAYKARAGGRGYQTLINDTLRRALVADELKEALREMIREELHAA